MVSAARRRSALAMIAAAALLLAGCIVAAVAVGSVWLPFGEVLRVLAGHLAGARATVSGGNVDAIIWQVRLPRVLMAALVGAGLSVSGAVYQSLLRNPLADPYLLGVSSGAGLAAVAVTVVGAGAGAGGGAAHAVPVAAFVGALLASLLIVALARVDGELPVANLVLAGVALGAMLSSMTAFLLIRGQGTFASFQLIAWLMGSLARTDWTTLMLVAPYVLVPLLLTPALARWLNLLMLGTRQARNLGVPVRQAQLVLLAIAGVLAASSVAGAGLVGFVGLIVPHAARLALGPDNRLLLPFVTFVGAAFVVGCDAFTRAAFAPMEVPVGIVTAMFGAPFFLWLLRRRKAMTFA